MSDGYEDWMDPSWHNAGANEQDFTTTKGLKFWDPNTIQTWVVKLSFTKGVEQNGKMVYGTYKGSGFFVRLSDQSDYHIIFTAAHNLCSRSGEPAKDMVAQYLVESRDSNGLPVRNPVETRIPPEDVSFNKDYVKTGKPGVDYGFIRIPKSQSEKGKGYGFSTKLSHEDLVARRGPYPAVTGFRDTLGPGNAIQSSGPCVKCTKNELHYAIPTEPGISGSVVSLEYGGGFVAVGIHNADAERPGGGNRGARISEEVLAKAFDWLKTPLPKQPVQIRAAVYATKKTSGLKLPPQNGLFLSFEAGVGFSRIRSMSGTKFDLVPVENISSADPFYALRLATGNREWVVFSVSEGVLRLSEQLTEGCYFQRKNLPMYGRPSGNRDGNVLSVKRAGSKDEHQLRMEGDEGDFDGDPETETGDISFTTKLKESFTLFTLE